MTRKQDAREDVTLVQGLLSQRSPCFAYALHGGIHSVVNELCSVRSKKQPGEEATPRVDFSD